MKLTVVFTYLVFLFTSHAYAAAVDPSESANSNILRGPMWSKVEATIQSLEAGASSSEIMTSSFRAFPSDRVEERINKLDPTGAKAKAFQELSERLEEKISNDEFTAAAYRDFILATSVFLNPPEVKGGKFRIFSKNELWTEHAIFLPYVDDTGVLGLHTLVESYLSKVIIIPLLLQPVDPVYSPHMNAVNSASDMAEHDGIVHAHTWMKYYHDFRRSPYFSSNLKTLAAAVFSINDPVKLNKYSYLMYSLIHENELTALHTNYTGNTNFQFSEEGKRFSKHIIDSESFTDKASPKLNESSLDSFLADMDQYWLLVALGLLEETLPRQEAWTISQMETPEEQKKHFPRLQECNAKSEQMSSEILVEFARDYGDILDQLFPELSTYLEKQLPS